jgi:AbrB family looped-hinge helix DNA binding protein
MIDCKRCLRYFTFMTATIYGRGQMVIPAKARKEARIGQGDVMDVRTEGDGRILLVRLEAPKAAAPAKARLVRRKGRHAVIVGARKVSESELRAALTEFP